MKANEAKLEVDKRRLRDSLSSSESRSTKLELLRRSLEGELQRAKVVLSDREAELQLLQERVTLMQRQVRSCVTTGASARLPPGPALPPERAQRGALGCPATSQSYFGSFPPHQVTESEARAGALQHSLDQLNLTLAKAADSETSLKEKVQGLTATLSESQSSSVSAQEKLLQLQKALAAGAHEQRVLQVGVFWVERPEPHWQRLPSPKVLIALPKETGPHPSIHSSYIPSGATRRSPTCPLGSKEAEWSTFGAPPSPKGAAGRAGAAEGGARGAGETAGRSESLEPAEMTLVFLAMRKQTHEARA